MVHITIFNWRMIQKEIDEKKDIKIQDDMEEEETKPEEFYTEGSKSLLEVRQFLLNFSLENSNKRLENQKKKKDSIFEESYDKKKIIEEKENFKKDLQKIQVNGSQIGDIRPVNCIKSTNLNEVITGSWSGKIKSWTLTDFQLSCTYSHHSEMVTGIAVNPNINSKVYFASGSTDKSVCLWQKDNTKPLSILLGHTDRLARINFHPCGRFLGTTSYDKGWRLWDIEKESCLYEQEGHSSAVYCIAFQCDGSLVATGDMDGVARVWDLRSGKSIFEMTNHVKQIMSIDWNPNGFEFASASDDKTVRIFDLRKMKAIGFIPAHLKLISTVKYEPNHGRFLITASYDHTIKIWTNTEFKHIKTLEGHDDRVMDCDITSDGQNILSCGWDKSWKIWNKTNNDLNF